MLRRTTGANQTGRRRPKTRAPTSKPDGLYFDKDLRKNVKSLGSHYKFNPAVLDHIPWS